MAMQYILLLSDLRFQAIECQLVSLACNTALRCRCYQFAAGMDQVGLGKTTPTGWAMLAAAVLGLVAGTVKLAHGASLASRAAAMVVGLLAGAIATVIWRGGQRRAPEQHQTE